MSDITFLLCVKQYIGNMSNNSVKNFNEHCKLTISMSNLKIVFKSIFTYDKKNSHGNYVIEHVKCKPTNQILYMIFPYAYDLL